MKKYQAGIEFLPNGEIKSTNGLIGGREINQVLKVIKLNKKTNTYVHAWFDAQHQLVEVWKLTKKEYSNLRCGFGVTDFGDFLRNSGLI